MYSEWYHLNIPQNQVFSTKAIYLPCRDKEQGIGDKTGDQGQRRKAGWGMDEKKELFLVDAAAESPWAVPHERT